MKKLNFVQLHTPFQLCEVHFENNSQAIAFFKTLAKMETEGRLFANENNLSLFADGADFLREVSETLRLWAGNVDAAADAGFVKYEYMPKREVVFRVKKHDDDGIACGTYSFVFRKEWQAYKAYVEFSQMLGVQTEGFGLDLIADSTKQVDEAYALLFKDFKESGFVDYAESAPADLKGGFLKQSPMLANAECGAGFASGGLDLTISDENPRVARLLSANERSQQRMARHLIEASILRNRRGF